MCAHAVDEVGNVGLQQRLTARDADAVEQFFALIEKGKELGIVYCALGRAHDQTRIVAERAAKIAAVRKERGGSSARIVQERQFLQCFQVHFGVSFRV